jgi:RNA polymerase sigma-32 factor
MKNQSIVKISGSKNERKLFFNLRKMKKSTTWLDNQEANDIALKLNVPVKEVLDMEQRLSATDISFNLDYDDEELSYSPEAHLEDYRYSPDKLIESKDTEETNSANLYEALETLDERSKDIIQRRWLNEDKPTLHELAAEYGVSHERIRQIENSAMKKIKVFLSEL